MPPRTGSTSPSGWAKDRCIPLAGFGMDPGRVRSSCYTRVIPSRGWRTTRQAREWRLTRSVKRRVSSGPAAWLTPEPLELTDPPSSSLSGPVPGRTATVGYLELIVSQRPPTQLENLAKIVSAARVVQAAVPICECSWTRCCFGPEPVLRT